MKIGNTYTYKQSEIPPLNPEWKKEMAELDADLGELIGKLQGNYHALTYLYEILDNCTDSCEMNLSMIRIVPDGSSDKQLTLNDLPVEEKLIVYSAAFTNSVLLNILSNATQRPVEDLAREIAIMGRFHAPNPSPAEVEKFIKKFRDSWDKKQDGFYFEQIG